MKVHAEVSISGSKEAIWKRITNIKNAPDNIAAIEKVEIHHDPGESFVGFKWTETRQMFGKSATETMTVTEAEKNSYYKTHAESHGAIYTSEMRISDRDGQTYLEMNFTSEPQTFGAKLMGGIFGAMFKGAMKKAIQKDLENIKKGVEGGA